MKFQQKLVLYFVSIITLFSLANDALGSRPSLQQGSPCEEYGRTDAVFIGVANRVVLTPNDTYLGIGPYVRKTTYFTIEEAFKGVGGTEIVFDSGHCGHLFKGGERYLVYAHRNRDTQQLEVLAGHTRTRPLSESAEDLQFIRGLASAEPGSRVFGKAAQYTYNINKGDFDAESLKNIKVVIEGNTLRQEVVTDSEGRYEFKRLSKGTYRILVELPSHLIYDEQKVKVDGYGCVVANISARRKAQITGRVFDSTGETLIRVPVSLVPADASYEKIFVEGKDKVLWPLSVTTLQGRFGFTQLPPGRYLLIINRTEYERSQGRQRDPALPRLFYPGVTDMGAATIIVVGNDDEPREYDFRLPIP